MFTLPEAFIISYKNPYRQAWDGFVLFLSVWNSIYVPIEISFSEEAWVSKLSEIDIIIDGVFIFDILVMFFTSYQDTQGREIKDNLSIGYRYITTRRFVTDSLSVLALIPILRLFAFLKMVRVFRLGSIIK
jgi:hypothetical protein